MIRLKIELNLLPKSGCFCFGHSFTQHNTLPEFNCILEAMATKDGHHYEVSITWTGNQGSGTSSYQGYSREHTMSIHNKMDIAGSSDSAFRGNPTRHNPEELLVASLASCHMLWYLHLCSQAGVVVIDYTDMATGVMVVAPNGGGAFTDVTLHPNVAVSHPAMIAQATELHQKAHELCFIANSVNFPVYHKPIIQVNGQGM